MSAICGCRSIYPRLAGGALPTSSRCFCPDPAPRGLGRPRGKGTFFLRRGEERPYRPVTRMMLDRRWLRGAWFQRAIDTRELLERTTNVVWSMGILCRMWSLRRCRERQRGLNEKALRGGGHLRSERRHAVHYLLLVPDQRDAERRQLLNGDTRGRLQGSHSGPLEALRVPWHLDGSQPLADRGQLRQVHRVRRQWIGAPVENLVLEPCRFPPQGRNRGNTIWGTKDLKFVRAFLQVVDWILRTRWGKWKRSN